MFDLWTEAVRSIEPMVKPAHRDLWLRPIECVGIDDGRIRLRAPNRYHKEWFEDNFLPSILKDLEARAQRPFTVDFEVVRRRRSRRGTSPASRSTASPGQRRPPAPRAPELVSRYTFDKFVVGPTNQFAHAAARMVAEAPAHAGTRCSSTAASAWARPTSCRPSVTRFIASTPSGRSASSPARSS